MSSPRPHCLDAGTAQSLLRKRAIHASPAIATNAQILYTVARSRLPPARPIDRRWDRTRNIAIVGSRPGTAQSCWRPSQHASVFSHAEGARRRYATRDLYSANNNQNAGYGASNGTQVRLPEQQKPPRDSRKDSPKQFLDMQRDTSLARQRIEEKQKALVERHKALDKKEQSFISKLKEVEKQKAEAAATAARAKAEAAAIAAKEKAEAAAIAAREKAAATEAATREIHRLEQQLASVTAEWSDGQRKWTKETLDWQATLQTLRSDLASAEERAKVAAENAVESLRNAAEEELRGAEATASAKVRGAETERINILRDVKTHHAQALQFKDEKAQQREKSNQEMTNRMAHRYQEWREQFIEEMRRLEEGGQYRARIERADYNTYVGFFREATEQFRNFQESTRELRKDADTISLWWNNQSRSYRGIDIHRWFPLQWPKLDEKLAGFLKSSAREVDARSTRLYDLTLVMEDLWLDCKLSFHQARELMRFHHLSEYQSPYQASLLAYDVKHRYPLFKQTEELKRHRIALNLAIGKAKDTSEQKTLRRRQRDAENRTFLINRVQLSMKYDAEIHALRAILNSPAEKEHFVKTLALRELMQELTKLGHHDLSQRQEGKGASYDPGAEGERVAESRPKKRTIAERRDIYQQFRIFELNMRKRQYLESYLGEEPNDRGQIDASFEEKLVAAENAKLATFQPSKPRAPGSPVPGPPSTGRRGNASPSEMANSSPPSSRPATRRERRIQKELDSGDTLAIEKLRSDLAEASRLPKGNEKRNRALKAVRDAAAAKIRSISKYMKLYDRSSKSSVLTPRRRSRFTEKLESRRSIREEIIRVAEDADTLLSSASTSGAHLNMKPTQVQSAPLGFRHIRPGPWVRCGHKAVATRQTSTSSGIASGRCADAIIFSETHALSPGDNADAQSRPRGDASGLLDAGDPAQSQPARAKPCLQTSGTSNDPSFTHQPSQAASNLHVSSKTMDPPPDIMPPFVNASSSAEGITELSYQIPADDYRNAAVASRNNPAAFWSCKLYQNPQGKQPVIYYCTNLEQTEARAREFLGEPVIGFDIEWEKYATIAKSPIKHNVSLVQIASEDKIALFQLALFKGNTPEELIPPSLRTILESRSVTKSGVNIQGDARRLKECLNVEMTGLFELSHLYKVVMFSNGRAKLINRRPLSLADQVQKVLLLPLKKDEVRTSAWSRRLTMQQTEYAASDAYCGFRLYHALEAKRMQMDPMPPRPAFYEDHQPLVLGDGTQVRPTTVRNRKREAPEEVVATNEDDDECEEFVEAVESPRGEQQESGFVTVAGIPLAGLSLESASPPPPRQAAPKTSTAPKLAAAPKPRASLANSSPEVAAADAWAQDFSTFNSARNVRPAELRAYHLWHMQRLALQDIAALLREPPLVVQTVASYVLEAVKKGRLPCMEARVEEVLEALPGSVKGRYRWVLEKARESKDEGHGDPEP